jgi:uncharacterized protein YaiI (UPF0178 family)
MDSPMVKDHLDRVAERLGEVTALVGNHRHNRSAESS